MELQCSDWYDQDKSLLDKKNCSLLFFQSLSITEMSHAYLGIKTRNGRGQSTPGFRLQEKNSGIRKGNECERQRLARL